LHSTNMTPFRYARERVIEIVKDHPRASQDEIVALAAAQNITVSQSTISHLRLQLKNGADVTQAGLIPFFYARPRMIEIIKANPRASQDELVALGAAAGIRISQSSISSLKAQVRNGAEPEYYGPRHANRQVKALESADADLGAIASVLEHLFEQRKFEFTCDPTTVADYAPRLASHVYRINHIVKILKEQGKKA
jgi:uncharacterized protein YneF (UPF0154 family)